MRAIFINIILLLVMFFACENSQASWFIDGNKYNASVHGQLSCSECHSDIISDLSHPSAEDINRTLSDFFNTEKCVVCHDEILERLESGEHGNLKKIDKVASDSCISCHDPHNQKSYTDNGNTYDIDEQRTNIYKLTAEEADCSGCHFISNDPSENIVKLCTHCHSPGSGNRPRNNPNAVVEVDKSGTFPHSGISCLECHKGSAKFGHTNQKKTGCLDCHTRHHEKITHDAHIDIPCGSCHLRNVKPFRVMENNRLIWRYNREVNGEYDPHKMTFRKDEMCSRCHHKNNNLGVSREILPAKSLICIPCHAGTFSAGDLTSIIALILFFTGTFSILLAYCSTGRGERRENKGSQPGLANIVIAFVLDGLLQRGLLKVSRWRWIMHFMIFFPFVIRFLWGLTALISSILYPEWAGAWLMLDKNDPVTALLFDLTGIIILFGGCGMIIQKKMEKRKSNIHDLPRGNGFIHILLGGIIITGFLVEGARISMTGGPPGSEYAIIGYAISRMMDSFDLTGIYSYIYYLHAVITGLFIACIPFSRMFHIILAPLSVVLKAASRK